MNNNNENRSPIRASFIAGILLILAGLTVFAKNFGIIDIRWHEIFSWQLVLIIVGMFLLCGRDTQRAGWLLMAIGVFFWVVEFVDLSETLRKLIWPAVLMVGGLVLIIGRKRPNSVSNGNGNNYASTYDAENSNINANANEAYSSEPYADGPSAHSSRIELSTVLSNRTYKPTTPYITGGRAHGVMATTNINLSDAQLEGNSATIEVSGFMHTCNITVPANWRVHLNVSTVMGSATDLRPTATPAESAPLLVVMGSLTMGACRILPQ